LNQKVATDQIPLGARILAAADSFDAMTSDRPYRACLPISEAVEEITRCSGTQFDPDVVKAFLKTPIVNSLKA
jgi:HD-GYP domain-containing protein (c-di-GMP phosphodiesterase class II)